MHPLDVHLEVSQAVFGTASVTPEGWHTVLTHMVVTRLLHICIGILIDIVEYRLKAVILGRQVADIMAELLLVNLVEAFLERLSEGRHWALL